MTAAARGPRIVQAGGAVVAALPDRRDLAAAQLKVGGAHPNRPIMWMPTTTVAGTMTSNQMTAIAHSITR